ncbi:hypothetical protein KI387_035948, partial [Taxus chinensis]
LKMARSSLGGMTTRLTLRAGLRTPKKHLYRTLCTAEFTMAGRTKVAAAQMTSTVDLNANFQTCSRLVQEAASAGVKLLSLPESFSFLGSSSEESLSIADTLDGPIMQRYCSLARESGIWLSLGGFQEKGQDDKHLFNTHVLVDDLGHIQSFYRKIH